MKVEEREGVKLVYVQGRIGQDETRHFLEQMQQTVDDGTNRLIIDLHEVEYMCSMALGYLVTLSQDLKEHRGALALVNPHENVIKLFGVTKLTKLFNIFKTEEAALHSVRH